MLETTKAVWLFILRYKMKHNGCQPKLREISEATGVSYSHVRSIIIDHLQDRYGLVEVIKPDSGGDPVWDIKGGSWLPPQSSYVLLGLDETSTSSPPNEA